MGNVNSESSISVLTIQLYLFWCHHFLAVELIIVMLIMCFLMHFSREVTMRLTYYNIRNSNALGMQQLIVKCIHMMNRSSSNVWTLSRGQ